MNKSDSIVIIPTYNEKENIEKIIRAVMGLEKAFNITIPDDAAEKIATVGDAIKFIEEAQA